MKKPRSAANPQLPLGDAYYNRNLFADHFLETRIGDEPGWHDTKGIEEAFTAISRLYQERVAAFTDATNEPQTEHDFVQPVLDILWAEDAPGDCYQVQVSIPNVDARRQPDYAFFTTAAKRHDAQPKAQTAEYWQDVACLGDAKKWSASLDKERAADENPSAQIANYLYRSKTRWGILTNGRIWRLYEQDRSRQGGVYYQVDLEAILHTRNIEQFKFFYMFFRRGAFTPGTSGHSFLDAVFQGSIKYATKVGDSLKESVYDALRLLMTGFCKYPGNGLDCGNPETLKLVHDNSLIVLYRLLFILFAEDRELLPCDDEHYEGYSLRSMQRQINAKLRAGTPYLPTSTGTWGQLCNLFALIDAGFQIDGRTIIPAYNGGLFSPTRHPEIAYTPQNGTRRWDVGDEQIAQVIDMLAYQRERWDVPGTEDVDYATLAVQHLGAIYEGLLELQPRVAAEPMIEQPGKSGKGPIVEKAAEVGQRKQIKGQNPRTFAPGDIYLVTDRGERKATGSYYTPGYIVDYIVEHTVGPLVEQAAGEGARLSEELSRKLKQIHRTSDRTTIRLLRREREGLRDQLLDQYLSLRVLDPAMGSGHFLVGAADFISLAMATDPNLPDPPDIGDEQPQAYYKRLVVERCLYGVDLNPLAVELAKLSLWLHTVSRDQALSFLDHRLRCGNSLIGARLREDLMKSPPAPDANEADSAQLQLGFDDALRGHDLLAFLGTFKRIAEAPSGSAEMERQKDKWYREMDALRERYRQVANIWLAPYFGVNVTPDNYAQALDALRDGPTSERWEQLVSEEWFRQAQDLAKEHRFFHWELEFPEAFFEVRSEKARWRDEDAAGFHAVIGNPPYVRIQALNASSPGEVMYYNATYDTAEGSYDIYCLFLEQGWALASERLGFIVPSKFIQSGYGGPLRRMIAPLVRVLVDFTDQQVFGDSGATNYTAILTLTPDADPYVYVTRIDDIAIAPVALQMGAGAPSPGYAVWEQPRGTLLEASHWALDPLAARLLPALVPVSDPLLRRTERIFQGLKTSADAIYVLEDAHLISGTHVEATSQVDDVRVRLERDVAVPLAKIDNMRRYHLAPETRCIIFPYQVTDGGAAQLISAEHFERCYPLAWSYLLDHETALRGREGGKMDHNQWYAYVYPKSLELNGMPKVLTPDYSASAAFCWDQAGGTHFCGGGAGGYGLVPSAGTSPAFLLALLNSSVLWAILKGVSSRMQHGYFSCEARFLRNLPIRCIHAVPEPSPDGVAADILRRAAEALERGRYEAALRLAYSALATHAALYGPAGKPELKADPRWARIIAEADTSFPGREDFVHDLLAMLAQRMIDLNKQKHDVIDRFETDLRGQAADSSREALQKGKQASTLHNKCPSCRPFVDEASHSTHQLHESLAWSEEAFEDFLRQLVRKVSHLSDLLAIYRTYTDAYRTCVDAIDKTDWLIDQIVYALYGLTEEEIALVEG